MELQAGRFYKSRNGEVWCCYRTLKQDEVGEHERALCVMVEGAGRVEYFYIDGRYDVGGQREHCLVEECGSRGGPLPPHIGNDPPGLNEFRDAALRIAVEHGFTEATVGEDIALMHSELSELLEDFRNGMVLSKMMYERPGGGAKMFSDSIYTAAHEFSVGPASEEPYDARLPKPVGPPSECADVFIRLAHFCGKHMIDLEKAVREKMAYNVTRSFKHGNKVV